jgi:hypothetical protein
VEAGDDQAMGQAGMVGHTAMEEASMSGKHANLYCVTCRQGRLFVGEWPSIGDWLLAIPTLGASLMRASGNFSCSVCGTPADPGAVELPRKPD